MQVRILLPAPKHAGVAQLVEAARQGTPHFNLKLLLKLIVLRRTKSSCWNKKINLEDGSSNLPRGSVEIRIKIDENLTYPKRMLLIYKVIKNQALHLASKVVVEMPGEEWVFVDTDGHNSYINGVKKKLV